MRAASSLNLFWGPAGEFASRPRLRAQAPPPWLHTESGDRAVAMLEGPRITTLAADRCAGWRGLRPRILLEHLQQKLTLCRPRRAWVATEIDDYLAALPSVQRRALGQLRTQLHALVPGADEAIKTRVPALRFKGKTVVGFGAAAQHLALYVMFGDALRSMKAHLARFDATARVVRFAPDAPLPPALVRKIVRFRLAEIAAAETPTRSKASRQRRKNRAKAA